jgi:hypothetical protein
MNYRWIIEHQKAVSVERRYGYWLKLVICNDKTDHRSVTYVDKITQFKANKSAVNGIQQTTLNKPCVYND